MIVIEFIEHVLGYFWNWLHQPKKARHESKRILLGQRVVDGEVQSEPTEIGPVARSRHLSVLGKTGSGKSFFLRSLAQQDAAHYQGFALFDQHGDLIPPILSYFAEIGIYPEDVVVIDPANPEWAVGMNPLEASDDLERFQIAAEITRNLADRWEFKGARTEELLRNTLFVLSANGLTMLETAHLLTDAGYRTQLLKKVANVDVKEYFTLRFNAMSEAMQGTMREPVLNKLSEFTADPHFRHILGQRTSTFSFDDALAAGKAVLVNVNKGKLGIHAMSFGTLVLGKLKAAIFRRQEKSVYAVYADEVQNLAAADTDFDVLFSEARKFGISLVTANQFLAQLPPRLRSAIAAIGTRVFFQLSSEDASHVAQDLDGGKSMLDRLRNLPPRHFILKSGHDRPVELMTPDIYTSKASAKDLIAASNALYARRREEIEQDIRSRRPQLVREVLDGWD